MNRRQLLKAMFLGAVGAAVCVLPEAAFAKKGRGGGRRRGGRRGRGSGQRTVVINTADTIKRLGDPTWYLERSRIIREVHAAAMRQVELNLYHPGGVGLGE